MIADDLLSLFVGKICRYFAGECLPGKCTLVKKHKESLRSEGDFSITLNANALMRHSKCSPTNTDINGHQFHKSKNHNSTYLEIKDNFQMDIIDGILSWPLKITQCVVQHERLCLFLSKNHTFESVLNRILTEGISYGKSVSNNKKIYLSTDVNLEEEWEMNMTSYRRNVIKCVITNLLIATGHVVVSNLHDETFDMHCHLSSSPPSENYKYVLVYCGCVINAEKETCDGNVVAGDYLRKKHDELKVMSHHKYGHLVDTDSNWETFFKKLGEATSRIDMLYVRPSRNIVINFHHGSQESSRNAHFILYNCARLAALQKKFYKECSDNIYPPLVSLEEIDVSLLVKEQEWELLTNYLLIYPQVLRSCIEVLDKGKPMPNLLCQFLYSLCACFSTYYRRVRVLTEPREHLMPVMFARIYLLKAIEQVLHNGLHLLGIEPVQCM